MKLDKDLHRLSALAWWLVATACGGSAPAAPTHTPVAAVGEAPSESPTSEPVTAPADDDYVLVPAEVVDALTSDQPRHFRVVPRTEQGRILNARLHGIDADSIVSGLGLRNGDTILAINGNAIATTDQILHLFAPLLATGSELVLLVQREGTELTLKYRRAP